MRSSQRPGELLERLVVLRASYRLRSSYDRSAVMRPAEAARNCLATMSTTGALNQRAKAGAVAAPYRCKVLRRSAIAISRLWLWRSWLW